MKKITFEVETTTPMFLAGADQSKAELRAASIKGLLRFWWRALQAESDLDKLRNRESQIFGSSDEKIGGGSSFSIRVAYNTVTSKSRGRPFPVNILEYLAYGPCAYDKDKRKNIIVREYIPDGFKFTISMNIFKKDCLNEILKTIYVFDLFGGLGSKSRNGFGSFYIGNKGECFEAIADEFATKDSYTKENLQKLIKQVDDNSYTSFVKGTKVFRTKETYNTWDKALGEVGKIYRGIRSGDIKIDNAPFEKHFKYDKRQYIASPIIVDRQKKSFLDRHAKPYFIKIAKEGNQYRAYVLYLPSRYCIELNNAEQHDREFAKICTEFNSFLANNMETVI